MAKLINKLKQELALVRLGYGAKTYLSTTFLSPTTEIIGTKNKQPIRLYENDTVLWASGQLLGGSAKLEDGSYAVFLSEFANNNMNDGAKNALIAHELGHIMLGHTDILSDIAESGNIFKILKYKMPTISHLKMEFEADDFACKHLGNRDVAQMLVCLAKCNPVYNNIYQNARIKRLEKRMTQDEIKSIDCKNCIQPIDIRDLLDEV